MNPGRPWFSHLNHWAVRFLSCRRKRSNDDDDDDDDNNNNNNNNVYAGTDSETALRDAFVMFDEEKKGKLAEE